MKYELPWLRPFLIGALLPAIIIALTLAWLAWGTWAPEIASWSTGATSKDFNVGVWGDSYGAYNALVGSLGFGAIAFTLLLQMRALKQQQTDIHKQRFESSFFQLLELLRESRQEFSLSFKNSPQEGIGAARIHAERLAQHIEDEMQDPRYLNKLNNNDKHVARRKFGVIYRSMVHTENEFYLGPFYRILYTILFRINSDETLNESEKIFYGNLVRSQFTSAEITLIGYNGLIPESKDLSKYIEHFRLLKYMPDGTHKSALQWVYDPIAFAPRDPAEGPAAFSTRDGTPLRDDPQGRTNN